MSVRARVSVSARERACYGAYACVISVTRLRVSVCVCVVARACLRARFGVPARWRACVRV